MPNIIEITDFHAPELDPYARLTQNQLRSRLEPEKGIFIAESWIGYRIPVSNHAGLRTARA